MLPISKINSVIAAAVTLLCLMVFFQLTGCGGGSSSGGGSSVTLNSIAVTPSGPSITVGNSQQFTATGTYSDNSTQDLTSQVTWSSSDTSKATVSTGGLATAVAVGTSVITATSGTTFGSTTLTVSSSGGGGGAPGSFTLISLVDGNASASATPMLQWAASTDATSYTVEVATSSDFGTTDVVNQTGITDTSYSIASALDTGVILYWRVTAVNNSGTAVASNAPFWFSVPIPAGTNPSYVAVTPDGSKAVVTNSTNPGYVKIISLSTHAVTDTLSVGANPSGVAITPDGSTAVVANSIGHSVSVINLSSKTVTNRATPCVADTLYDIAVSTDGSTAFLGGLGAGCIHDGLYLMNISSGVYTYVDFGSYSGPFGVAVTPNGNSVLTTNGILGSTIKMMAVSGHALTTITSTGASYGVAVTPDSSAAILASAEGTTVKRITLGGTNAVTATIAFESNQQDHNVAITPDGTIAVVIGDFNIGLISLADNTVIKTYPIVGINVAITPDSKTALVTAADGTIKVVKIQ